MSEEQEELATADGGYSLSGSEDTAASSISLSLGENSVRLREKSKPGNEEAEPSNRTEKKVEDKRWWLKRPETRLGLSASTKKSVLSGDKPKETPLSDMTSSMKEFLQKEELCKAQHKTSGENNRDKDDTLCDILASTAFDKYPSDFENATDEDIGSFLEEMSKIAGALSPSSAQERMKSGENSSKNPSEEEKSVEELLEEAEKLVRENVGLSKSSSRSETLILEEVENQNGSNTRIVRLEKDIFQLIEQEVQRESEKIRKSPKNEKNRKEASPGRNKAIYENENSLKPPIMLMTLESQKKRFEDEKVEISSSSDLDDPIERHSKSEDPEKMEESRKDKENLQKEITDVDKDFFDDLLRRSKEKMEGGMSGSSSFGQEDFSHFLRILQGQDRKEQDTKEVKIGTAAEISSHLTKAVNTNLTNTENIVFPEKEISEILEKELPQESKNEKIVENHNDREDHEFCETDSSLASGDNASESRRKKSFSRKSSQDRSRASNIDEQLEQNSKRDKNSKKSGVEQSGEKSFLNSKNELYTVGLTPRLELFADAIPKLIAEKTNENLSKASSEVKNDEVDKTGEKCVEEESAKKEKSQENLVKRANQAKGKLQEKNKAESNRVIPDTNRKTTPSPDRSKKPSEKKSKVENVRLGQSRSYDQLTKPISNLRASLDDVRNSKSIDTSRRYNQPGKSPVLSKFAKQRTNQIGSSKQQAPRSKLSLNPSTSKFDLLAKPKRPEIPGKYHQAGGDSRKNLSKDDLESLYHEEKHKNALLKEQIDSEAKVFKQQMQNMRTSFEEELFSLKKQNIILKAKIDEFTLNEKRGDISKKIPSRSDTRNELLEKELEKQEGIINAYETENKRLVTEMERLQEEIKSTKSKQRTKVEINETQKLNDTIKDLREDALKLNLEVSDLRQKNSDSLLKIDDLSQQNSLLKEELEMFKDQLKTKNEFINARLQAMTAAELESRKKTDDMRVDLSSKTEQLKNLKIEYEKLEQAVLPLEKELLELRMRESSFTEKMQVAKSHIEREKQLTLKLKDQVILDNKKILDLNRQVREMERILKRKNPDSVSALILTAKSDHERIHLEKVKLLEDRIASLEGEIKAKEEIGQEKLTDLRTKFSEMKEKYVSQVADLEERLFEAMAKERKIYCDSFTQTVTKSMENKSVDAANARREEREHLSSAQTEKDEKKEAKMVKTGPKSQNPKEDTHLIATIRGLKMELANKDKHLAKINKEFQELQKTNRRLQKERERLLNDRRTFKSTTDLDKNGRSASVTSDPRLPASRTETNDLNSNHFQNGHFSNGNTHRLSGSAPRLYDPLQYSENDDRTALKKLTNENGILKEELNKINKDYMMLKNKRLHDLNLLQEEHEREMASLVKEYSLKFGDSKVVKLQGQINTQVAIITHLKQQIEKLRDYKEQVVVLKVEREHLENKVKILNEKVKYLTTPGTEQLQLLQDKITILQQRHESREITLQSLVRDLLRKKTQCRDCKGEKGKSNKQLCYFRQELDHILGMLQEISNVQ
ncbi:centrosomal protein of 162 kDa [Venturia canescens]|uniref:centrosomal protein of 162 kDa n=1 Tax=Venturia canescens TaxID=32260 RepID=UPI001C9CAF99|nr:centrosomal protein of 162 kDa-like [Venturia canescens]